MMTVQQLMRVLAKFKPDQRVFVSGSYQGDGGCHTCGYGGTETFEQDINEVVDLETKVHIVAER